METSYVSNREIGADFWAHHMLYAYEWLGEAAAGSKLLVHQSLSHTMSGRRCKKLQAWRPREKTQHCCSVNTSTAVSLFKMWGLSHLYVAPLLTECIGPRRPSVLSRWDYSKKQARGAKECCFPALRHIAADKRRESHSLLGNNMISPKPNLNNLIASSLKLSTQLDWQCKYMNKQFNINSCHKRGLNVGE